MSILKHNEHDNTTDNTDNDNVFKQTHINNNHNNNNNNHNNNNNTHNNNTNNNNNNTTTNNNNTKNNDNTNNYNNNNTDRVVLDGVEARLVHRRHARHEMLLGVALDVAGHRDGSDLRRQLLCTATLSSLSLFGDHVRGGRAGGRNVREGVRGKKGGRDERREALIRLLGPTA